MKQTIKKLLPKNRFTRSVSVLAGGTAAGQGIVILSSPLLTRLYSPEDFGLLAVYSSMLGIIGVVASFRYQLAIPLPERDEEAAHVVVLSLLLLLAVSLLTALVVLLYGQFIAALANTPRLAGYMWLLPIGLLTMGIYQVFYYWAIRTKSFPAIARTKLTQSTSMVAVQLAGYVFGPLALLVGRVCGNAAGTTTLGMLALRNRRSIFFATTKKNVMQAALRYKRFPIFSIWGGAFNTAGTQLPPLLFAALFSSSAAGIYMLAHRVLSVPMTFIGTAIADVFFSTAAEAKQNDSLSSIVAGVHDKLAKIAMPPALFLILTGPDLFAIIFGTEWKQAGVFAQWMAPWVYFAFVTSPISTLSLILEKQAQGLIFQGTLLVVRLLSLTLGSFYNQILLAIELYAMGSALCYIIMLIYLFYISENQIINLLLSTIKTIAISSILVAPLAIFHFIDCANIFWLPTVTVSAALITGRYIFFLKEAW